MWTAPSFGMDRRSLLVVAVTLTVVLAGCSGFTAGDGTSTPAAEATSTPTSTPTPTQSPTSTPGDGDTYPAGWSETGVTNTTTAMGSHYRAVLSGPATTVTYRSGVLSAESDRAANTSLSMRVDTGDRRLHAEIDGTAERREAYLADGTFSQWSVDNETLVSRSEQSFIDVAQSVDNGVLKSQLLLYELELNRTVVRQGTAAFRYDVTGIPDNTVSGTYGAATSASGHVVVSRRGRVLEIQTTVTYTGGEVTYHYSQTDIGETEVETPSWVSE